jgi:hypothetical protein
MIATNPTFETYDQLIPVARQLYEITSGLSWKLLLPLFLLSIAMSYSTELGVTAAVIIKLKRLLIVALLLAGFPTIAEFSQNVGVEIARSIDDMTGIDFILEVAAKRADEFSFNLQTLLTLRADFLLGALTLVSFLILNIARYFLVAFQHFYWFLLVITGPFLILPTLFESASGVTRGLFKSMIQVAAWPIIWSILSAFLKAIPFAVAYSNGLDLITVITLNLIIAIALLFSPFMVSHLTEGAGHTLGDGIRRGMVKAAAFAVNPKAAVANFTKTRAGGIGKNLVRPTPGGSK